MPYRGHVAADNLNISDNPTGDSSDGLSEGRPGQEGAEKEGKSGYSIMWQLSFPAPLTQSNDVCFDPDPMQSGRKLKRLAMEKIEGWHDPLGEIIGNTDPAHIAGMYYMVLLYHIYTLNPDDPQ